MFPFLFLISVIGKLTKTDAMHLKLFEAVLLGIICFVSASYKLENQVTDLCSII